MASAIDQIVPVTITATSATPQVGNFGTPALLAYHTYNPFPSRTYFGLSGLLSDGFSSAEPAYLMASALMSQNPTVTSFQVIRGTSAQTWTAHFGVVDTAVGESIGFTLLTAYKPQTVTLTITTDGAPGTGVFSFTVNGTTITGVTIPTSPYQYLIPGTGYTITFQNIAYSHTNSWVYTLTPGSGAANGTVTVTASGSGALASQISVAVNRSIYTDVKYTPTTTKTAAQIATALAALSADGVTLAVDGSITTQVNVTANVSTYPWLAGAMFYPATNPDGTSGPAVNGGSWTDVTASASPATDLSAAVASNPNFYGVSTEHTDANNIVAVSGWCASNNRMNYYTTADTNNLVASTGVGHTLELLGSTYDDGYFSSNPSLYVATAVMARAFVLNPGTYTEAYKQLQEVLPDVLTPTSLSNLGNETFNGNRLNYYITIAGVNVTRFGMTAGGMYADLRRGIDALAAKIQQQVYNLLVSTPKVAYDPIGIAMVGAEVQSALAQFTANSSSPAALLRNDPGFQPVVILPSIASTSSVDRGQRILRNVQFTAWAQNAIQVVQINGTINL